MSQQNWQAEVQRLAVSDVGFATGLLVAQLMQAVQQLSEAVAALQKEWQKWHENLEPLLQFAEQGQAIAQTLQQVQATLSATQQQLAQNFLATWQQWEGAQQATEWASRTMSYQQILRQLIADVEGATDKKQFAQSNSLRFEMLTKPFQLPSADTMKLDWLKRALEAEGNEARQKAIKRLEELGIQLRVPEIGAPFESKWQQIVDGRETDDLHRNDTIAEVYAPSIIVNGEVIISARVVVWKARTVR